MNEENKSNLTPEESENREKHTPDSELESLSQDEKKRRVRDLNKMIKKRESLLSSVNSQIDTLKPIEEKYQTISKEYNTLIPELEKIREEKSELETEIPILEEKHTTAEENLDSIQESISAEEKKKSELTSEVSELTTSKENLQKEIEELKNNGGTLNQTNKNLNSEISKNTKERDSLNNEIINLKDKLGLYSKDLADIVRQNTSNRNKYAGAIAVSFSLAIFFIIFLICLMRSDKLVPDSLNKMLNGDTGYVFYESILIRASVMGSLIFIILIFINLTRGFISQFIRNQEKVASITVLDFLSSRLGAKNIKFSDENLEKEYAREVLKEQIKLMSDHLPEIIKDTSTNFDKISKTAAPTDNMKEMLQDLIDKAAKK